MLYGTATRREEAARSVRLQLRLNLVVTLPTDGRGRVSQRPPAGGNDLMGASLDDGPLSRVAWLNSRLAVSELPPPDFSPLSVSQPPRTATTSVESSDPSLHLQTGWRTADIGHDGLPRQLTVNGHELLAAPIALRIVRESDQPAPTSADDLHGKASESNRGARPLPWRTGDVHVLSRSKGAAVWQATSLSRDGMLQCRVRGRAEFDGWLEISIDISSSEIEVSPSEGGARKDGGKGIVLEEVELSLPLLATRATYALGLGYRGGYRPEELVWSWETLRGGKRKYQRGDHALWVGDTDAGVQLNLKGSEPAWDVPFGMEGAVPPTWNGRGGGTVTMRNEAVGGTQAAHVVASAGRHVVSSAHPLTLRFSLLMTPVRKLQLATHVRTRHYHTRYGQWNAPSGSRLAALGTSVLTLHQGTALNPFINYPFLDGHAAKLRRFVGRMHVRGVRVKLYLTTKELSTHAPELPLLRELGNEILSAPSPFDPRRGSSYVQEHLSAYSSAWCTHSLLGSGAGSPPSAGRGARGGSGRGGDAGGGGGRGGDGSGDGWKRDGTGGLGPSAGSRQAGEAQHEGGGRSPADPPADFEDQAVKVNGHSRWTNFYVNGVAWLVRRTDIDGIYLDGIRHPREVSQRLRRVLSGDMATHAENWSRVAPEAPGGAMERRGPRARLLDLHAGPNLRSFLEHLPYVDSLWVGENIAWGSDAGPDYWLVAISGILRIALA